MNEKKIIRCAVYTRKSSEEGLEMAYNLRPYHYGFCTHREEMKSCSEAAVCIEAGDAVFTHF